MAPISHTGFRGISYNRASAVSWLSQDFEAIPRNSAQPRPLRLDSGHHNVEDIEVLDFGIRKHLGRGNFATVDEVELCGQKKVVAVKKLQIISNRNDTRLVEKVSSATEAFGPISSSIIYPTPFRLDGGHHEIKDIEELNNGMIIRGRLGCGTFATVDKVELRELKRTVALKRFRVTGDRSNTKLTEEVNLATEVAIMGKVKEHRHIVKFLASYICYEAEELGFFLEPVANGGDLGKMLRRRYSPSFEGWKDSERQTLHTCFGCLAGAVAFVHQKRIRHKDITLANVLIHHGKVLLSDFGIAFDASLSREGLTTTDGAVGPHTERYAAPEVVKDGARRNRKTDVFALGGVYIEVMEALGLIAIAPKILKKVFRDSNKTISQILNGHRYDNRLRCLTGLVQEMILDDLEKRPRAKEIVERVTLSGEPGFFCQECFAENNMLLGSSKPI